MKRQRLKNRFRRGAAGMATAGYSLVELMITVAIIAVLITIGYPSLMNALPNMRLKSAARELYSVLQSARMNAVKTNSTCSVVFDTVTGNGQYTINCGSLRTVKLDDYGSGVTFGSISYSNNTVSFSSRGLCISNNGSVTLKNQNNQTYKVTIFYSGAISMSKGN